MAAFPARRYKDRRQDLQSDQGFLPRSTQSFFRQLMEQKASPVEEPEEVLREGLSPGLRRDRHRIQRTVSAVKLGEGLFENGRESRLVALKQTDAWDGVFGNRFKRRDKLHLPHWWIPAERAPPPAPAHSHLHKAQPLKNRIMQHIYLSRTNTYLVTSHSSSACSVYPQVLTTRWAVKKKKDLQKKA